MKKTLQIANIIAFVATVFINYLSNTGAINGTTIGDVSDSMKNLFTPAGYAFSIWGLIYVMLLGFVIYQSRSLFTKVRDDVFVLQTGWWFVLSCFANMMWILFWLYGFIEFSILAIFVLLFFIIENSDEKSNGIVGRAHFSNCIFVVAVCFLQRLGYGCQHHKCFGIPYKY